MQASLKMQTILKNNKTGLPFLIVALDYDTREQAMGLVDKLGDRAGFYKVGMQLFYAEGATLIHQLKDKGKHVFLDLKINDIPRTIEKTVAVLAGLEVDLLTLFTAEAGIKAAVAGRGSSAMALLNVTVLTSEAQVQGKTVAEQVLERAMLTARAGGDGVICSGEETRAIRDASGDDLLVVNPGIRLAQSDDDQKRVVTPQAAWQNGASYIVVGRPVTQSADPVTAVDAIYQNIAQTS